VKIVHAENPQKAIIEYYKAERGQVGATKRGFRVSMPEASGEGGVDVRAGKGPFDVLCECKRLRREAAYNLLAVELLRWLHSQGLNVMVDVTFGRTPKGKIAPVVEDVKSFVEGGRPTSHSNPLSTSASTGLKFISL